ncbi:hypothetical protein D3C76_657970 [compost metagenome]
MDDALGCSGGAGGIQNEQRMVEGHPNEGDLGSDIGRDKICVAYAATYVRNVRRIFQIRHYNSPKKCRQTCRHFTVLFQAINTFAVVPVAINAQQQLGLDLPKTVEYALHTEVWRGTGPNSAQRCNGQHGNEGFRHVRHETGDPIAFTNAQRFKALTKARNLVKKFAPCETALNLVFAPEHHCIAVIAASQQCLCIIQPCIREPARSRHLVAIVQHDFA